MNAKRVPRNPFVAMSKFRKAGFHTKPAKSLRRQEKQALAKTAKQSLESWQKRISFEFAVAMASSIAFWDGPEVLVNEIRD